MKKVILIFVSIITTAAFAQTKEIAYKSHSGNMEHFNIALQNDLFGNEASNFGIPSPKETYLLDSVIYISESATVLVRRMYVQQFNEPKDSARLIAVYKDTINNSALLGRKHSLDSIRSILKIKNQYGTPAKNIIFVGYDNIKTKEKNKNKSDIKEKTKQNTILPVAVTDDNNTPNSPFDISIAKALAGLLLLSLFGGWISWRFNLPQLQKA